VILRNPCNAGFARASIPDQVHRPNSFSLNNDAQLEPKSAARLARIDRFPSLAIAGVSFVIDGRLQNAFAPLPHLSKKSFAFVAQADRPCRFRRKSVDNRPFSLMRLRRLLCVRSSVMPPLGFLDEAFLFLRRNRLSACATARLEVCHLPLPRPFMARLTANRFRVRPASNISVPTHILRKHPVPLVCRRLRVVSANLSERTRRRVACLATLFLNRRLRTRAATYWYLVCWHILLRPPHGAFRQMPAAANVRHPMNATNANRSSPCSRRAHRSSAAVAGLTEEQEKHIPARPMVIFGAVEHIATSETICSPRSPKRATPRSRHQSCA